MLSYLSSVTEEDETGYRPDAPDSFGLPPDTIPTTTRYTVNDIPGAAAYLPWNPQPSSAGFSTSEDLYSAEDSRLPTSSRYTPNEDVYSADISVQPPMLNREPEREHSDIIDYGRAFQEWDREYSSHPDRASDLQAALLGMDFGLGQGETVGGTNEGERSDSSRRIGTLETIEE
jgi:hypothetical protein